MKTYYGIAELAKELNWTTEKTHVYFKRGKFRNPAAMVGNRPLWTLMQITQITKEVYRE
jgi:hypothetical protein